MRRLHWVTLVLTALVGAAGCQDSTGPGGQTSVVRPTEPATLTVTPSTAIVGIGNSVTLRGTVLRTDGSRMAPTGISWTSSDEAVAKIGTDGIVQGKRVGRVKINAAWRGQQGSAYVTVINPDLGDPAPCKAPGKHPCN